MNISKILPIAFISVLLTASQAHAVAWPPWFTPEDKAVNLYLKSRHISESDIDHTDNEISVTESDFDFSEEFKFYKLPMSFGIHYKHVDIDENSPVELPSHLEGVSFLLGAKFPAPFTASENWFMGVDILPMMYTDDGKWQASAFRIPFRGYLLYRKSENFIFIAGLSIRPDFDTVVTPIIGFIYKPNDRLTFNLASSEPNVTYELNDKSRVLFELNLLNDEYEVTRNGENGVVLKYNAFSMGTGYEYDLTRDIHLLFSTGYMFARELEYEDSNGKVIPEGGVYTNFKASVRF